MLTTHTAASLIAFEARIRDHFAAGALPCLIHLSGGNEEQLLRIFADIGPDDWVFSTHRNHYHALLKGIPPEQLEADILAGRSMFIYSRAHKFVTSSILAGTCALAAGVAWQLKQQAGPAVGGVPSPRVWCFLGDGAEEQGHFYEAALFAESQELPLTFIIEDNNRQVDTPIHERRGSPELTDRYDTYGVTRFPLGHFNCIERYNYTPTYPHGGAGLPPGSVTFQPAAIDRLRATA